MAQHIEGKVVSVDSAGNLITDITAERLEGVPRDESVTVLCDEHRTNGIYVADHGQPDMTFIAVINADNMLELIIVGESAHRMLDIQVGEKVSVEWP